MVTEKEKTSKEKLPFNSNTCWPWRFTRYTFQLLWATCLSVWLPTLWGLPLWQSVSLVRFFFISSPATVLRRKLTSKRSVAMNKYIVFKILIKYHRRKKNCCDLCLQVIWHSLIYENKTIVRRFVTRGSPSLKRQELHWLYDGRTHI